MDDVFRDLQSKGVSDVGLAKARVKIDPHALNGVDHWSKYVKAQGGRDARGYTLQDAIDEAELNGVKLDKDKIHAHHINMKLGPVATQAITKETAEMIADFGIDPYFGIEALAYVPDWGGHSKDYAKAVNDTVKALHQSGSRDKASMARKLNELTTKWLNQEFLNKPANQRKPWKILPRMRK